MHPSAPYVKIFDDSMGYTAIYLQANWVDGLTGWRMYKYRTFVPSIGCTGPIRSIPAPTYPDDWSLGQVVDIESVPESIRYMILSDVLQVMHDVSFMTIPYTPA